MTHLEQQRHLVDRRIFACPRCGGPLACIGRGRRGARCRRCREPYAWRRHAFDFFPYWEFYGARRLDWLYWRLTQEFAVPSYENRPEAHLAAADRDDTQAFRAFCDGTDGSAEGIDLDVGSGILVEGPGYVAPDRPFVGVEPILHATEPQCTTVRGTAEFLPLADGVVSRCYIGTSVDHFIYPDKAMGEVKRCLAPDGRVLIWLACLPETFSLIGHRSFPNRYVDAPLRSTKIKVLRGLERLGKLIPPVGRLLKENAWKEMAYTPADLAPLGIVPDRRDPYHLGHYSLDGFMTIMREAGYACRREERFRVHERQRVTEYFLEFEVAAA